MEVEGGRSVWEQTCFSVFIHFIHDEDTRPLHPFIVDIICWKFKIKLPYPKYLTHTKHTSHWNILKGNDYPICHCLTLKILFFTYYRGWLRVKLHIVLNSKNKWTINHFCSVAFASDWFIKLLLHLLLIDFEVLIMVWIIQ